MSAVDYCIIESAPTSPGSRLDAGRQNSSDLENHSSSWLSADYAILPVLSSSAPEREGPWHEVKRKSTERLKVTMPKEATTKQRVEVRFDTSVCCSRFFPSSMILVWLRNGWMSGDVNLLRCHCLISLKLILLSGHCFAK